jgi:hypothetical protein
MVGVGIEVFSVCSCGKLLVHYFFLGVEDFVGFWILCLFCWLSGCAVLCRQLQDYVVSGRLRIAVIFHYRPLI